MSRVVRIEPHGDDELRLRARFSYDEELIHIVKQVPGRTWDKGSRSWAFPNTPENLRYLRARLPRGVVLHVDDRITDRLETVEAGIEKAAAARDRGDSDLAFEYVTEPYAHQRAGLEFLTHIESGMLTWEMGAGKTKTAIDYAEWLKARSPSPQDFGVLVICPNTVKRSVWARQIPIHAGHSDFVVPEGTLAQRAKQVGTNTYTIINCEALSHRVMADELRKDLWDLVIVDESTRFKDVRSARTKNLHKIKARYRLMLTGTPIVNTAEDVWGQYHFIAPGLLGTWQGFRDTYLVRDWFGNVTGVQPAREQELKARMDSRSYRVLKADVLDLPPKVYEDRTVTLDGDQAKAYAQMRDELRVQLAGTTLEARSALTQLLRLTQITAGLVGERERYTWLGEKAAKVRELDAILNEELRHEQVVIFGLYQRELEELALRYTQPHSPDSWVPPIIYGPTPEARRAELIEQFQSGSRRLLFAQSRTGGIGIDLHAAQYAVYHTRGWSLEDYLQSQDRLHRIGQRGTVTIIHLTAEGTVDTHIAKALDSKQNLADRLTGDDLRKLVEEVVGEL